MLTPLVNRVTMVTMNDIAERAAVSRATVSYVLSNRQRSNGTISNETRQRVLDVAAEMGYRMDELARAMVTGKYPVIGVVVSHNVLEHEAKILAGIIQQSTESGYMVKILPMPNWHSTKGIVGRAQEWRLAGLIAIGMSEENRHALIKDAARAQIRLAIVGNVSDTESEVAVSTDNEQGTRLLVEHLIDLGHQRIGFLGGEASTTDSLQREASLRKLLREKGVPVVESWIRSSSWADIPLIQRVATEILSGERPTAIICAGDPLASLVMGVASQMGLNLPADLSVAGYSNAFMSAYTVPALTTIDQNFSGMGQEVTRTLIDIISSSEKSKPKPPLTLINTQLIVRSSTSSPGISSPSQNFA